jgi:RNA polymerase sigma-70 factor (ECF subfamily)
VADDAVAEAFARLIQAGETVRRPFPWLFRIAFRIAAAELRDTGRSDSEPAEDRTPRPAAGPETEGELLAHVLWALRALSPAQRAAVFLHYQADLPVREVATRMGTSVAAVKVHLFRGRARLRDLLGTKEDDDG